VTFWSDTPVIVTRVEVGAGVELGARTVTANVVECEFPKWSVAVTVTLVVPGGNVDPLGGVADTVGSGSTTSVAVALG
jgi:hypothetical protein